MERAKRAKRATMIEEGNLTAAARPGSASRQPSLGGNFGPPHFSAFFFVATSWARPINFCRSKSMACSVSVSKTNQPITSELRGLIT